MTQGWAKGIPKSPETRQKMSDAAKGRKPSLEARLALSKSNRERICSPETRAKMSEARKGRKPSLKNRLAVSKYNKGLKHPSWRCLKNAQSRKGKKLSLEHRQNIGKGHLGKKHSEETKCKLSQAMKGRQMSEVWLKKIYKGLSVKPNYSEKIIDGMLQKLFPGEYKFVGDWQVWIGGKNPDFINVNGQKKIVEFFGHRWHKPEDEEIRKAHFKQYGFDTLIIWGNELKNVEILKEKLRSFHEYLSLNP
jgi:hypothetical protein